MHIPFRKVSDFRSCKLEDVSSRTGKIVYVVFGKRGRGAGELIFIRDTCQNVRRVPGDKRID